MVEDMQAEHRQVKQLFGPDATVTGRMGSGVAPGNVQIHIDGRRLGCGRTFQQALTIASKRLAKLVTTTVAGVA